VSGAHVVAPDEQGIRTMNTWRTVTTTAIRITTSSATLVAVAALVGAGHKWV
jgi:hypothetical protein